MSPRKELTDFQKGEIVALIDLMSHRDIGIRLNISHQIVTSFLKRLATRGSVENIHRPDAPWKTFNSDDRYIVHTAERNTRIPLTKLHAEIISNISEQILHHRLHEARIRKWRAIDKSL